jgi:hypothetical protein
LYLATAGAIGALTGMSAAKADCAAPNATAAANRVTTLKRIPNPPSDNYLIPGATVSSWKAAGQVNAGLSAWKCEICPESLPLLRFCNG